MTVEEKRKLIEQYCNTRDLCRNCAVKNECDGGLGINENNIDEALIKAGLISEEPPEEPVEPEVHDVVNHPKHYTNGAMECIDEMILLFGKEAVKHFCVCNAWKYRYRANSKNGDEDLKKADWYIAKFKELS